MSVVHRTATLQAPGERGLKFWLAEVLDTDGTIGYRSESWSSDAAGRNESVHVMSAITVVKGKNIGRSNATTAKEQAIRDVEAKARKKMDKGYVPIGTKVTAKSDMDRILPMLAENFTKREHKVTYPVLVQPKQNGMRLLFDGKTFWSRGLKEPPNPKCVQHLRQSIVPAGMVMDGEILLPFPEFTFQEGLSATKRFQHGLSELLRYVVYDCYVRTLPDMPYVSRLALITQVVFASKGLWELCPTWEALNRNEVMEHYKALVSKGWEGAIVRDKMAPYAVGKRVDALLKLKPAQDQEFRIVGVKDGKGKEQGVIMFTCETKEGKQFDVRPMGSYDDRRAMWTRRNSFIGKLLTVRFINWTDDKLPFGPRGVVVRDYE